MCTDKRADLNKMSGLRVWLLRIIWNIAAFLELVEVLPVHQDYLKNVIEKIIKNSNITDICSKERGSSPL